jgi:GT2 family glycosyltransferase
LQDLNKVPGSGNQSVSVIIVNYNAGALLASCVASALGQSSEIIIVDNASADHSTDAVASTWPHIKIIKNGLNLGFATACNIGARAATGSHFFFLNPDCVLATDAVQRMLDAADSMVDVGMVGGLLVDPDGTEQGGGRRAVPTPWRSLVRATGLSRFADRWPRLFYDFHLHKQPLPEVPIEVEAISGACMLVPRHAMEKVGAWDEAYFLHCEDLDLCMRFRRIDWKILFVPSAKVVHEKGACSHHRPIFVEWHKHKGMLHFYRKFFRHQYPGVLMGLVAVGVWLRFGLVFTYYSSRHIGRTMGLVRD